MCYRADIPLYPSLIPHPLSLIPPLSPKAFPSNSLGYYLPWRKPAGIDHSSMRTWHVFVDESGDHSLCRVDADFPVLVLAAVLVDREAYLGAVIPAVARLKTEQWGHEGVVLHSSDIRRQAGPYACLQVRSVRERFLGQLEDLMRALPYRLYVAVLDKRGIAATEPPAHANPYSLALASCVRQIAVSGLLGPQDAIQVVAESRGAH